MLFIYQFESRSGYDWPWRQFDRQSDTRKSWPQILFLTTCVFEFLDINIRNGMPKLRTSRLNGVAKIKRNHIHTNIKTY